MPRGANNTDPRDRRVIIVASPAELRRCASRAVASAVEVNIGPLLPAVGEVAFRVAVSAIANLGMRKLTGEALLQQLEDELRLGIPIALYDQSEATRLLTVQVRRRAYAQGWQSVCTTPHPP